MKKINTDLYNCNELPTSALQYAGIIPENSNLENLTARDLIATRKKMSKKIVKIK